MSAPISLLTCPLHIRTASLSSTATTNLTPREPKQPPRPIYPQLPPSDRHIPQNPFLKCAIFFHLDPASVSRTGPRSPQRGVDRVHQAVTGTNCNAKTYSDMSGHVQTVSYYHNSNLMFTFCSPNFPQNPKKPHAHLPQPQIPCPDMSKHVRILSAIVEIKIAYNHRFSTNPLSAKAHLNRQKCPDMSGFLEPF